MSYQKMTLNKKLTGRKIHNIILQSQYTFEDVAFVLELTSPRVLYDWANGKKLPSLENFYNLVMLLNVNMKDVLVFD